MKRFTQTLSMSSLRWVSLLGSLFVFGGCDAITRIDTPELEVNPSTIQFANPLVNEGRQTMALTIRNVGDGFATITRIALTEVDVVKEVIDFGLS